jgi:hypothetical protein
LRNAHSVSSAGDLRENELYNLSGSSDQPEHGGDGIVKTQGITHAEVETALALAGLDIPERERADIAAAAHFIEEMAARLRGKREMGAEPAHIFPPPEGVR